jgi:HPt (histidine-containing phosphotransfer) domain-containing protein
MITGLAAKIGQGQLRRLLHNVEPVYREEYTALLESIKQQNKAEAIRLAHSLKNTAGLFACQGLVDCLKKVEQGDLALVTQDSFRQQLERDYQACLNIMRQLSGLS